MINTAQKRQQEIQKMLQDQQQLQQYNQNKESLLGKAQRYNGYRNRVGNLGKQLMNSNNPNVSNFGSKLYQGSGNQAINNFKTNGLSSIKSTPMYQNMAAKFGAGSAGTGAGATTAGATTAGATGATTAGTAAGTTAATTAGTTAAGAGAGTAAGTAAGTTAATAGGTAAAGGGAAAGAAGASAAVPVAGWIAAAAIIASQMYKSHKNKQAAKAAEKSMKALNEVEQQGGQRKAEAMQGLEQQNLENEAAVDAMSSNPQMPEELKQEMMGKVFYPQYEQPTNENNNTFTPPPQDTSYLQQTPVQNTSGGSDMQKSSVAQEILSQIQGQDYSNQYSPYSSNAIEEEIRRRGLQ